MGFDIGRKRLGVAVSDESGRIASPVVVLEVEALKGDRRPLVRLIEDYEPKLGVVGLPLTLKGEEGVQADEVRALTAQYLEPLGLKLVFFDERLSSREAKRTFREAGVSERRARGKIDMIAATLFLQAYLDNMKADV